MSTSAHEYSIIYGHNNKLWCRELWAYTAADALVMLRVEIPDAEVVHLLATPGRGVLSAPEEVWQPLETYVNGLRYFAAWAHAH